jgi:hypothetical protein
MPELHRGRAAPVTPEAGGEVSGFAPPLRKDGHTVRGHLNRVNWTLMVCLIAGAASPAATAQITRIVEKRAKALLGKCQITVTAIYSWRDWMPIVSSPGPDGGSPLHSKVSVRMDNSEGEANRYSFKAVVVDARGRSYPVTPKVLPNFRVLPDEVANVYRGFDEQTKEGVIAKYNVEWDGVLKAGESRVVELAMSDGPYLPIGSRIHMEITWTNQKGESATVKTPEAEINRTD